MKLDGKARIVAAFRQLEQRAAFRPRRVNRLAWVANRAGNYLRARGAACRRYNRFVRAPIFTSTGIIFLAPANDWRIGSIENSIGTGAAKPVAETRTKTEANPYCGPPKAYDIVATTGPTAPPKCPRTSVSETPVDLARVGKLLFVRLDVSGMTKPSAVVCRKTQP